mgnify:CR=1 FL=1
MKITEYKKKNGTIVYRASVYLGVDKLTGKRLELQLRPKQKQALKSRQERPLTLLQTMDIV